MKQQFDRDYTEEELYWFTRLLIKRSEHRVKTEKKLEDINDALNYLMMLRTLFVDRINRENTVEMTTDEFFEKFAPECEKENTTNAKKWKFSQTSDVRI